MPRASSTRKKTVTQERDEIEHQKIGLELQKLRLEEDKSWFEFHKHMTTLNTGVIILIATLIEKVFTNTDPQSIGIIAVSFFSFLGSITFSTIGLGYHMPSLRIARPSKEISRGTVRMVFLLKYAKVFLFVASLVGFLMGIFFFVVFSLGNF
jgi:hypothetical protein